MVGILRADKVNANYTTPVCVGCHLSILFGRTDICLDADTNKFTDYHTFMEWSNDVRQADEEQTELYRTLGCTTQDLIDAGAGNPKFRGIDGLNPFGLEDWRVHPAEVFARLYEQKKAEAEKVPSTP